MNFMAEVFTILKVCDRDHKIDYLVGNGQIQCNLRDSINIVGSIATYFDATPDEQETLIKNGFLMNQTDHIVWHLERHAPLERLRYVLPYLVTAIDVIPSNEDTPAFSFTQRYTDYDYERWFYSSIENGFNHLVCQLRNPDHLPLLHKLLPDLTYRTTDNQLEIILSQGDTLNPMMIQS